MPNDNIFAGGDPATSTATPTPESGTSTVTPDPIAAKLADIKGDDGVQKYANVNVALDALKHSQEYIKQLKQQLEETSQKAAQAVTLEQVMAAMKTDAGKAPEATAAPSPGLTAEDVLNLLQREEKKKVFQANTLKVAQKFKEVHGEKAEEVFYSKAADMGLSKESINQLAATSPDAVFSMFGMKDKIPATPTPSGINSHSLQDPAPTQRKPVMGFKTDRELLDYWTNLKNEVATNLGIKN